MTTKKAKKVGRPKVEIKSVPVASIKGSPDFKTWFDGLRKHIRLRPSDTLEHALIALAKERGYEKPAPER